MDTVDLLPNSILSLSGRAADKLLALGDPDAALVYLHILRHNAPPALNWDGPRLQAALDKLAAQKLIAPAQAAPAAPAPEQEVPVPEYSLSDVTAALSGSSPFSALADEVEYKLGLAGVDPARVEGRDGNNWRVLDYSSVLVHVFDREAREFYNLDKLYTDFE